MDELKRLVSLYCDLINYNYSLENVDEYLDETAEVNEDYNFNPLATSVSNACDEVEKLIERISKRLFSIVDRIQDKKEIFGVDFTINEEFKDSVENALMCMDWGYDEDGNFENFKLALQEAVKAR